MKFLAKKRSIQMICFMPIIVYIAFYITMLIYSQTQVSLMTMISGLFFLLIAQYSVLYAKVKNKLLVSSTLLIITTTLLMISFEWIIFSNSSTSQSSFTNIGVFVLFLAILTLSGVGIYLEVLRLDKMSHITHETYDLKEALFIEYSKKTHKLRLEFSKKFQETHALQKNILVIAANDFIQCLHPSTRLLYESFEDFIDKHDKDDYVNVDMKFGEMKSYASLHLKGAFTLEHRFVCLAFDITKENRHQNTLIDQTKKLNRLAYESQKIIENTGVFISKMKTDGTIVFASESLANIYDLGKESIVGKNALKLSEMHGDFDHAWFDEILQKGSSQGTSTVNTKDKTYHISWKNDVLFAKEGHVEYLITVGNDITDIVILNQRLEYQSTHDSLTGLLNYRGLLDQLQKHQNIDRAVSFFIDVRDLSFARDYYGNEISDYILAKIADEIYQYTQQDAIVSRYYGDQFVVVCINPSDEKIATIIDKLEDAMLKVYEVEHANVQIKKNIGYAIYKEHTQDIFQLISLSSLAMKASQKSVHNQIIKYHPMMSETLNQNIDMAYRLHQAIIHSKIEVYFQKIMNVQTKTVAFIEALSRWEDEKLGFVRPDHFFEIAKASNLIDQLEAHVVHQAIYRFAHLKEMPTYAQTKLTINLSPTTFLNDGFAEVIANFAMEYKIATHDIVIEVSENTFVHNLDTCNEYIKTYRNLGFLIAIDDFGSQYSSLSILEHIYYDIIKIDGAFIMNLKTEKNKAIIQMIHTIASLGHKTMIAESVETKEISDSLLGFDCYMQQGYYFHKPEKLI